MISRQEGDARLANLETYDSYYNKPSWWFRFRYDTQIKRKTVMWLVKQAGYTTLRKEVLEIGFGSGVVLFSFDPDCRIAGVETSVSAVNNARRRALRLRYVDYDLRLVEDGSLPFSDAKFDIVVASHVLEHVPDADELLEDIKRVLKPGGIAVILVPINERYDDPRHVRSYTPESLTQTVIRGGLDPILRIESELLFYIVERFYYEGYSKRWRIVGPIIAAIFNFSLAMIPFKICRMLDKLIGLSGLPPRQVGMVVGKPTSRAH